MSENFNQLGAALQERYQLKAELGRGGMATVYLAHDIQHGRRVAIKVLHPELAGAVGHDRFLREIRIASDLSHPHILPLLDSGSTVSGNNTLPFYVMPFVEGESLRARLQRERQLPIEEAMKIAHDVATALSYAHAHGVVHRDIKPENILLAGNEAVVADFGIARAIDRAVEAEVITSAGLAVGTPAYMSPEQGAGHQEVDGRSDIYSLGCVLYEMLGGEPPFSGPNANAIVARHRVDPVPPLRTIRPSVPASLEALVLRSLEKVPADRFKTAYQFAAALGPQHTPSGLTPAEHPGLPGVSAATMRTVETPVPQARLARRVIWMLSAALVIATFLLITWWGISRWRENRTPQFSAAPEWSAWRGWDGEFFPVFAVGDSMLVIRALRGEAVQVFDGQRWATLSVPDSFELLRYVGSMPDNRLLAAKRITDSTGVPHLQYWWMAVSAQGIQAGQPVGDIVPDQFRPSWWSDGREVTLWLDAMRRADGAAWTVEPTGTRGGIASVWGRDFHHRFAIPSSRDSVLVFDGISWSSVGILAPSGQTKPNYQAGASFPDGASVVLGDECIDEQRCRPFVLQQDTAGGPWKRIPIPATVGIPITFPDTAGPCEPSQFTLTGLAGRSRDSYFIWGSWSTCLPELGERGETVGCPPRQPCFWQVRDGRVRPVQGLLGRVVQAVGYSGESAYALLDDGTLSRHIQGDWRPISQVPGLPLRMVGASPRVVVRLTGANLRYEPGYGDRESPFTISPMQGLPDSVRDGMRLRRLVVRDSVAALLTDQGLVFLSLCRIDRVAITGTQQGALRCSPWDQLAPASGDIRDIAILPDGRVIGVGARGLVIVWQTRVAQIERLPPEAREDSFWGVSISAEGRAVAVGSSVVTERDSIGQWSVIRRIQTSDMPNARFLVLSNGDMVLAQGKVEVWDRTSDSVAAAVLYQLPPGGSGVGALHVLADGRLILGLSNPDEPLVSGSLVVWAAPARANRSQAVPLPINMDITDLTDDGRFLHVVGRGGSLRIPLDSLPFYTQPAR